MSTQIPARITRREALARIGAAAAGLTAACSPAQVLMKLNPGELDIDLSRVERNLRAFALTIVPAASPSDPALVRPFYDANYPLAQFRGLFAADLARRARARSGVAQLDHLPRDEREAIVREGLHGDPVMRRLYTGAVFMVQLAVLGGIYSESAEVPLLGFEGQYQFRGIAAITYPDPQRFLAPELSLNGNPA
jgi:hypothetical protein